MIVYESAASPSVRSGEAILGGRRVAARLLPYGFETGRVRFDPIERRFVFTREDIVLRPGPFRLEGWREALSRVPPGPVLIGPSAGGEAVWGSTRAAAEAAHQAGRPVFLLDPEPEAIPDGIADAAVVLCSWRPGSFARAFPGLERARAAGARCAAVFPLIPGWTAEDRSIEALADTAARDGAVSLTSLLPMTDGEGRRDIVAARSGVEPEEGDRFFEVIHHGDWPERLSDRVAAARKAASERGLAVLPPRPAGGEPAGNRAAAARLEERAEVTDPGEHRGALLYAAVRWIDESSRDLAAVAREGNFRKVFPFDGEVGAWAEAALLEAGR